MKHGIDETEVLRAALLLTRAALQLQEQAAQEHPDLTMIGRALQTAAEVGALGVDLDVAPGPRVVIRRAEQPHIVDLDCVGDVEQAHGDLLAGRDASLFGDPGNRFDRVMKATKTADPWVLPDGGTWVRYGSGSFGWAVRTAGGLVLGHDPPEYLSPSGRKVLPLIIRRNREEPVTGEIGGSR